jgi:hypothetical protein
MAIVNPLEKGGHGTSLFLFVELLGFIGFLGLTEETRQTQ